MFRAYHWQAYVSSGVGLWPMLGVHRVAAVQLLSVRGCLLLLKWLYSSHSINIVVHTALGISRVTQSLHLPYMVGRDVVLQVGVHPMTQSSLNLWWVLP